jgi:restriction endonuclease Mrr
MPIPDYETLMLPLTHFTEDGKEHSLKEVFADDAERILSVIETVKRRAEAA